VIDGVGRAASALTDAGWEVVDNTPPELERCSEIWAHLLAADVAVLMEAARPILSEELSTMLDDLAERYSPSVMAPHLVHSEVVRLAREWSLFLVDHPVVLMPAWTEPPFEHGVDLDGSETAALAQLLSFITPPNLLGIPSVAVPVGISDGLPQGVQCVADRWRDDLALAAAADLETALGAITPIDPVTS
jgi:amidase